MSEKEYINKFVFKLSILVSIVLLLYLGSLFIVDRLNLSDWAYKRFTEKKHYSLIIGTSRAAQGIHPQIINDYFSESEFQLPIYNFAFTISASPYGEIYYNSIKKILGTKNNKNGLFILSVDPWALSMEETLDSNGYREINDKLGIMKIYNQKPNLEYLIRFFRMNDNEWFINEAKLENDGWYKVDFNMDQDNVKKNIVKKIGIYKSYKLKRSEYRLKWFIKTLNLLKQYGDVFLCRIPVHKDMLEIENNQWKNFDSEIQNISKKYNVPYYNFIYDCDNYRTIDGNHLYKDDGAIFTKKLCDSISYNINGIIK